MSSSKLPALRKWYNALFKAYGPQSWWPGDGPTEIIVGAILTQNTNWRNVLKAIGRLKIAKALNWRSLQEVPVAELAELIRPAGYYNVKARRLKNFVEWLWNDFNGDLKKLRKLPLEELREMLLAINGIGPETADSILLYALDRPTFVIDAYTRRVAVRHHLVTADDASYEKLKATFEAALPRKVALYNEYHALIVAVAKKHCATKARCDGCPLQRYPHDAAKI